MVERELNDIRRYWAVNYPTVDITLYANEDFTKFFGSMRGKGQVANLSADTIGELISQGEAFLRKVK